MTDKRQKAKKVKCKQEESLTKQSIFVQYSLLWKKHLSFAGARGEINATKRFPNANEDSRTPPKMCKDNRRFLRRNPTIFQEYIITDNAKRLSFFYEKPSKHLINN